MSSSVTIQISRNRNVARDRSIAILKLNKINHLVGQPMMVKYFAEPGISNKIDTLFALGIKNGIGEDCYKIISLSGLELIRGVSKVIPDISQLVHGELYLYQDKNNIWNYVYEENNERKIEPIVDLAPTVFVNIEDKFRWFWNGKDQLKREDDFYSGDDMMNLLDDLSLMMGPPQLSVYSETGYLFPIGETIDITLKVKVLNTLDQDITRRCSFYANGVMYTLSSENTITIPGLNKTENLLIEAKAISREGKTYTYSTNILIEFGFDFFYGPVEEDWELSEENLSLLEHKIVQTRKTVKYSSIQLDYKKLVYSFPEMYGELYQILDEHGLDYLEDYTLYKTPMSNGITYNTYVKNDAIVISDFEQTYLFSKKDEEEIVNQPVINQSKYDEVVAAWEKQNTTGGIVVVDETGKIPNHLISGLDFSSEFSFIALAGFLNHYPNGGEIILNTGDKWYNTEEKKLYIVTGNNTGYITDLTENTIYLNNKDKMFYLWSNGNMTLVGESFESTIITDVVSILD